MKTYNKIINLFDLLSLGLVVFLLVFVWIKFYLKNIITSLILSIVISLLFIFISYKTYNKKIAKDLSNKNALIKLQKLTDTLTLSSYEENLKYLNEIFPESKIQNNYLSLPNNSIIIPKFDCLELTTNDLLSLLKDDNINKTNSITIVTLNVDKSCQEFASTLNIKINFLTTSDILKLNSQEIESAIKITQKKHNTFKSIAKMFTARKNVKGYITSSIFIIFASLIVPYKTYYLISASVLLILAFLCITLNNSKHEKRMS